MKLWTIPFGMLIGAVALGMLGAAVTGSHEGAYIGLVIGAIFGGVLAVEEDK